MKKLFFILVFVIIPLTLVCQTFWYNDYYQVNGGGTYLTADDVVSDAIYYYYLGTAQDGNNNSFLTLSKILKSDGSLVSSIYYDGPQAYMPVMLDMGDDSLLIVFNYNDTYIPAYWQIASVKVSKTTLLFDQLNNYNKIRYRFVDGDMSSFWSNKIQIIRTNEEEQNYIISTIVDYNGYQMMKFIKINSLRVPIATKLYFLPNQIQTDEYNKSSGLKMTPELNGSGITVCGYFYNNSANPNYPNNSVFTFIIDNNLNNLTDIYFYNDLPNGFNAQNAQDIQITSATTDWNSGYIITGECQYSNSYSGLPAFIIYLDQSLSYFNWQKTYEIEVGNYYYYKPSNPVITETDYWPFLCVAFCQGTNSQDDITYNLIDLTDGSLFNSMKYYIAYPDFRLLPLNLLRNYDNINEDNYTMFSYFNPSYNRYEINRVQFDGDGYCAESTNGEYSDLDMSVDHSELLYFDGHTEFDFFPSCYHGIDYSVFDCEGTVVNLIIGNNEFKNIDHTDKINFIKENGKVYLENDSKDSINDQAISFSIYSIEGKLLYSNNIKATGYQLELLDISGYSKGIYLLRINTRSSIISSLISL